MSELAQLLMLLWEESGMDLVPIKLLRWAKHVSDARRKRKTSAVYFLGALIGTRSEGKRRCLLMMTPHLVASSCMILPAPRNPPVLTQEPVLVNRTGVITVWTDGSGRYSDDPHHRRCVVGSEFLAVVRALEKCHPHEVDRSRPRSTRRHLQGSSLTLKLPVCAAHTPSSCGAPPVGGATGGPFLLASEVRSGNRPTAAAEPGNRFPAPVESGGTNSTEAAAS
eukprot:1269911-Amphidinium_carterae.1